MPRHDDDEDDDRPRSRGRRRDDDDEDDDERPRSRSRRRDADDDDWDRRGGKKKGGGAAPVIILVVVAVLLLCVGGGGFGLYYAVTRVREAAARANDSNNLKQIGVAFHMYANNHGTVPPHDANLSWRVHLLPYMEQESLYRQFDTDAAWNVGKNKSAADVTVKTYTSALDDQNGVLTRDRVFTGEGTIYEPGRPLKQFPGEFTDGQSNTLFAVEAAETVPWAQPKELDFSPNGSLPSLGHPDRNIALIVLADGSVRSWQKKRIDPAVLRALITPVGKESVTPDW